MIDAIDVAAREALSDELRRRHWETYGVLRWSGIAVRKGLVLVVGIDRLSPTLNKAGRGDYMPGLAGHALCPFCLGTTRIDDVVPCRSCQQGMMYRSTWSTCMRPWPMFGYNPRGKAWHVEHDSERVASGGGVRPIGRIVTPEIRAVRAAQLVDRIEREGMQGAQGCCGTVSEPSP